MVASLSVLVTAAVVDIGLWSLWHCDFAVVADCLVVVFHSRGSLCAVAGWTVNCVFELAVDASVVVSVLVIASAVEYWTVWAAAVASGVRVTAAAVDRRLWKLWWCVIAAAAGGRLLACLWV